MMAGVPSPSVPIHWSAASTVVLPLDVANTLVPASELRLPKICMWIKADVSVGLEKVSMVRAKSSPPVLGTVISRETVNCPTYSLPVSTLRPLSAVRAED